MGFDLVTASTVSATTITRSAAIARLVRSITSVLRRSRRRRTLIVTAAVPTVSARRTSAVSRSAVRTVPTVMATTALVMMTGTGVAVVIVLTAAIGRCVVSLGRLAVVAVPTVSGTAGLSAVSAVLLRGRLAVARGTAIKPLRVPAVVPAIVVFI